MSKKYAAIDLAEFHKRVAAGDGAIRNAISVEARFLSHEATGVDADSRVETFVFSDDSTDLYGDKILAAGWVFDRSGAGTVALFGHDSSKVENIIGRAHNIRVENNKLIGDIHFAAADVNPNAETVMRLVRAGVINSVSVGFQPLEWTQTKDKSRPGGVDFKRQKLLEISVVGIPANENAIALAKAAGIDADLIAALSLPTQEEAAPPIKVKSLWHIAWLADILMDLDILEDCVEWETSMEEDGSVIADRLKSELQSLGQILIDMTIEEVTELLADPDAADAGTTDAVVEMSARAQRMRVLKSLVKADKQVIGAVLEALAPKEKPGLVDLLSIKTGIAIAKAGKVLSSDNEKKLRDAHDMLTKGCETIMGVLGAATPADDTQEKTTVVDSDEDKAVRTRRARALQMRVAIETAA